MEPGAAAATFIGVSRLSRIEAARLLRTLTHSH
jgi:hypothetical protein